MADSTAPKPEKKKAQRVGVDTCLLCINTVADADKLDDKDVTESLLEVIREKGHTVSKESVPGKTPSKAKVALVLNGKRYMQPASRKNPCCLPVAWVGRCLGGRCAATAALGRPARAAAAAVRRRPLRAAAHARHGRCPGSVAALCFLRWPRRVPLQGQGRRQQQRRWAAAAITPTPSKNGRCSRAAAAGGGLAGAAAAAAGGGGGGARAAAAAAAAGAPRGRYA